MRNLSAATNRKQRISGPMFIIIIFLFLTVKSTYEIVSFPAEYTVCNTLLCVHSWVERCEANLTDTKNT